MPVLPFPLILESGLYLDTIQLRIFIPWGPKNVLNKIDLHFIGPQSIIEVFLQTWKILSSLQFMCQFLYPWLIYNFFFFLIRRKIGFFKTGTVQFVNYLKFLPHKLGDYHHNYRFQKIQLFNYDCTFWNCIEV